MLTNVYLKTLRDQRRGLIGWRTGLLIVVFLEATLWPTVRDMGGLREFVASYPEALRSPVQAGPVRHRCRFPER